MRERTSVHNFGRARGTCHDRFVTTRSAPQRTRRGAPEVVEKRRAARQFNDVLLAEAGAPAHDGRTERRRKRLYRDLERAADPEQARTLKPLDVLKHVEALLELGEPLARIRKAYPPRPLVEPSGAIVDGVRRVHRAYRFRPDVYRFVGLGPDVLERAGVARAAREVRSPVRSTQADARTRPRPPARARARGRRGSEEDAA